MYTLFTILILALMIFCIWVIAGQRRTIDKLTDKLMARDYADYRRGQAPTAPEVKQRKPMTFYDDPTIELEDESIN